MFLDTWPQIKRPDRHAEEYEQFDGPKIFWSAVKDFDANFLAVSGTLLIFHLLTGHLLTDIC